MYACGLIGIVSTLVFELLVPIGFFFRRLRSAALLAMMVFHLLILSFSAIDFSLVCMSAYPLIADASELKRHIEHYVKRPTRLSLGVAALYTLHCTVINVHDKWSDLSESAFNFAQMETLFRAGVTFGVAYLIMRGGAMLRLQFDASTQVRNDLRGDRVYARARSSTSIS